MYYVICKWVYHLRSESLFFDRIPPMQQHLVFKASAQLHGKLDLILLTMVFMQLRAYRQQRKAMKKWRMQLLYQNYIELTKLSSTW